MLRAWASALNKTAVRVGLIVTGAVATVAFGPLSAFGAYMLVLAVFSDAPDRYHFIGWSIVGAGGLLGMIGAWVRLLAPNRVFRGSRALRWVTACALGAGVVVTGLTFVGVIWKPGDVMAWLMLPATAIGIFLLGATLGEVRSNSALVSDTSSSPLRAQGGAAQRRR